MTVSLDVICPWLYPSFYMRSELYFCVCCPEWQKVQATERERGKKIQTLRRTAWIKEQDSWHFLVWWITVSMVRSTGANTWQNCSYILVTGTEPWENCVVPITSSSTVYSATRLSFTYIKAKIWSWLSKSAVYWIGYQLLWVHRHGPATMNLLYIAQMINKSCLWMMTLKLPTY